MTPPIDQAQMRETTTAISSSFKALESRVWRSLDRVDPWADEFVPRAHLVLTEVSAPLWLEVRQHLSSLPERSALQQAWAVAMACHLWVGMLFRSCISQTGSEPAAHESGSPLEAEAWRLRKISLSRWASKTSPYRYISPSEHDLSQVLIGDIKPDAPAPDFGSQTKLPGEVRLRFRLAALFREGATWSTLLEAAANQKAITDFRRHSEFTRALRSIVQSHRRLRPLRDVEVALLSDKARALLHKMAPHWPTLLAQSVRERAQVKDYAESLGRERVRISQTLSKLMECVRGLRLGELDELVTRAGQGVIAKALWAGLRTEPWGLSDDHRHPGHRTEFGTWVPTTFKAIEVLQEFAPQPLPAWWVMTASGVATWLIREPSPEASSAMTTQEIAIFQRSWSREEKVALLRAGKSRFVASNSEAWGDLTMMEFINASGALQQRVRSVIWNRLKAMHDARPWLKLMAQQVTDEAFSPTWHRSGPSAGWNIAAARKLRDLAQATLEERRRPYWAGSWGVWVASTIGTPEWHRVRPAAIERTRLIMDAVHLYDFKRAPIDVPAFRLAVAKSLNDPDQLPDDPVFFMQLWLGHDPQALSPLAKHAPTELLRQLAAHRKTPTPVLQTLSANEDQRPGFKTVQLAAWQQQLRRATDATQLKNLLLHPPAPGDVPWSRPWFRLQGDDLPMALVLAAGQDRRRLSEARRALGAAAVADAIRQMNGILNMGGHRQASRASNPAVIPEPSHGAHP